MKTWDSVTVKWEFNKAGHRLSCGFPYEYLVGAEKLVLPDARPFFLEELIITSRPQKDNALIGDIEIEIKNCATNATINLGKPSYKNINNKLEVLAMPNESFLMNTDGRTSRILGIFFSYELKKNESFCDSAIRMARSVIELLNIEAWNYSDGKNREINQLLSILKVSKETFVITDSGLIKFESYLKQKHHLG